jgi:Holliday junction resolvase-like predicted endonuclease
MLTVTKANGNREPFSEQKVESSIRRAGIPLALQPKVIEQVRSKVYDGIPTQEIYHHIQEYLRSSEHPYSQSKYGLKQAIMSLGPTGYPFEDFIAAILETQGYKTKVRQFLNGSCVNHEVDVVAEKDGKRHMIEAKFHNNPGVKSDVQVTLYTKARFDDVKVRHHLDETWVVTNTKTTLDAIAYANCIGMKIMSWSYPQEGSLRDLIESQNLYPVTILTHLSDSQKLTLLENHTILCRQIKDKPIVLDQLNLPEDVKKNVLDEVEFICSTANK